MDPVFGPDQIRPRLAVLWTGLIASGAMLGGIYLAAPSGFFAPYQTTAVLLTIALIGYELIGAKRTEVVLIGAAIIYGVLSLIELRTGLVMSFFDSGATLGILTLLGILFTATRVQRGPVPVILFSLGTSAYTVISLILQDMPLAHLLGRAVLGVPGQILAMWVTFRIIDRLGQAATRNAKSLAIQKALARCSHLLLISQNKQGVQMALAALLDATEADYAYIDVNRTEEDERITWQISHDALGANVPDGPSSFGSGTYDDIPWVAVELAAGRPVRIQVAELPEPIRSRYVTEGVRSELAAPIMVAGKWVGTIGFTDFWRDGTWSDLETEALTTAADLVAGAWERDRAREGLEELADAKDRFIAAVSHELRTPLSGVVGFASALRDGAASFSSEEVAEMAGLIAGQSQEVADLVDDLLTSERAGSGHLTVWPVPTELGREVESVIRLLPDPPRINVNRGALVLADGLRTRQIIRNLLTNAGRYGGEKVRIEIDVIDGMGRLTVLDDGQGVFGIDEDRIFNAYYRAPAEAARPDSVGLGLAVARQLARLMSGDLVYRRQDNWTRFELTLPLDPGLVAKPSPIPDGSDGNLEDAGESSVVPAAV